MSSLEIPAKAMQAKCKMAPIFGEKICNNNKVLYGGATQTVFVDIFPVVLSSSTIYNRRERKKDKRGYCSLRPTFFVAELRLKS